MKLPMRWPLRYQILFPMAMLMIAVLVSVSSLNAYLSAQNTKQRIHQQISDVAETLKQASFPLTDAVLEQTHGLSGAEFAVVHHSGRLLATSIEDLVPPPLKQIPKPNQPLLLEEPININSVSYFMTTTRLSSRQRELLPDVLYIFYPVEIYRIQLRNAVLPPILVGAVALLMTVLLAMYIASRVTRPLNQLKSQVNRIAEGDFEPMQLTHQNDEILDLGNSVNRMTQMLADYELEVRKNERLKLLGQISGSMAHQLRNAATGCRMALDLHQSACPLSEDDDTLDVATRQLTLIEQYIGHFFSRTRNIEPPNSHEIVNITRVAENVINLLKPGAEHVGVQLNCLSPEQPVFVTGDSESLEQLLINLLQNAIDAAATPHEHSTSQPHKGRVDLVLRTNNTDQVVLEVIDSGPGPDPEVSHSMFEPLITGKIEGTGLGLSVAQEIAQAHNSEIKWEQREGTTCFFLQFENSNRETSS